MTFRTIKIFIKDTSRSYKLQHDSWTGQVVSTTDIRASDSSRPFYFKAFLRNLTKKSYHDSNERYIYIHTYYSDKFLVLSTFEKFINFGNNKGKRRETS